MRPAPLFWLQLLAVVATATAADTPPPPAAVPTAAAAASAPVPATPTTVRTPLPLASLFFPSAGPHQMRALDGGMGGGEHAAPWLASLARSFPAQLRAFDRQPAQSREAVSAIEEFTGPLVRFATGGQPVAADVEQLIDSIPHLARSANALKETGKVNLASLDFSSLPSNLVAHVLNGGPVPGIDRAELDRVVREHLKRMSDTADRMLRGETVEQIEKILPPLDKVPMEMVMSSLQGKTLPGLTAAETGKIREYYTKQLPSHAPADSADTASPLPEALTALGRMVQLLPPGYDVGRIPPEFIESLVSGRVPDVTQLPADLQAFFNGKDQAMMIVNTLNSSVTELLQHFAATLRKLPEVERAAPYDISKVTHEVFDEEAIREQQSRNVLYTVTWVAVAFAIAAVAVVWLLYKKCADPIRRAPLSTVTPPARERVDASRVARNADVAGAVSPRLRHVASFDSHEAKLEFAAKACRYSTPKPQLVLESPEVEKMKAPEGDDDDVIDEKTVDDVKAVIEKVEQAVIEKCEQPDDEEISDSMYDDTTTQ